MNEDKLCKLTEWQIDPMLNHKSVLYKGSLSSTYQRYEVKYEDKMIYCAGIFEGCVFILGYVFSIN